MTIKTRMDDSRNWIMNSKESLVILMLMGTGLGTLCFSAFAIMFAFSGTWFLVVLFGVFVFGALKKFISILKMIKKIGFKDALGGVTAASFVWRRDKDFKKIKDGGVLDGSGEEQGITESDECNAERNKKSRGQVRGGKEDTQPANPWDSLSVRIDESNRKETGDE